MNAITSEAVAAEPDTVPIEIVSRWDSTKVLFRAEVDATIPVCGRIKVAVLLAIKRDVSLSGADLRGADLRDVSLRGADLSGADLRGADLRDVSLRGADLSGADLDGADLRSADLRSADLRSADLSGADLRSADLIGADLRSANLSGADLSGADLRSADLIGASLSGADLIRADLSGADLRSADLSGADLIDADLSGAKITLANGTEILLAEGRSVLSVGPIGSENGTLLIYRADDGALYAKRGCYGPVSIADFETRVMAVHADGDHGREYRAAVEMARAWGAAA